MRRLLLVICFAGLALTGIAQDDAEIPFQLPQEPPNTEEGQLVEWEGWSFRWQFRDIEGLMLNNQDATRFAIEMDPG